MFRLLLWINASPAPPSSAKRVGCGVGAGTQHSLCLVGEKLSAGWGLESDTRVGIPTTLQACPDTRVSRAHTGTCMHTRASHRHTRACTVTLEGLPQPGRLLCRHGIHSCHGSENCPWATPSVLSILPEGAIPGALSPVWQVSELQEPPAERPRGPRARRPRAAPVGF